MNIENNMNFVQLIRNTILVVMTAFVAMTLRFLDYYINLHRSMSKNSPKNKRIEAAENDHIGLLEWIPMIYPSLMLANLIEASIINGHANITKMLLQRANKLQSFILPIFPSIPLTKRNLLKHTAYKIYEATKELPTTPNKSKPTLLKKITNLKITFSLLLQHFAQSSNNQLSFIIAELTNRPELSLKLLEQYRKDFHADADFKAFIKSCKQDSANAIRLCIVLLFAQLPGFDELSQNMQIRQYRYDTKSFKQILEGIIPNEQFVRTFYLLKAVLLQVNTMPDNDDNSEIIADIKHALSIWDKIAEKIQSYLTADDFYHLCRAMANEYGLSAPDRPQILETPPLAIRTSKPNPKQKAPSMIAQLMANIESANATTPQLTNHENTAAITVNASPAPSISFISMQEAAPASAGAGIGSVVAESSVVSRRRIEAAWYEDDQSDTSSTDNSSSGGETEDLSSPKPTNEDPILQKKFALFGSGCEFDFGKDSLILVELSRILSGDKAKLFVVGSGASPHRSLASDIDLELVFQGTLDEAEKKLRSSAITAHLVDPIETIQMGYEDGDSYASFSCKSKEQHFDIRLLATSKPLNDHIETLMRRRRLNTRASRLELNADTMLALDRKKVVTLYSLGDPLVRDLTHTPSTGYSPEDLAYYLYDQTMSKDKAPVIINSARFTEVYHYLTTHPELCSLRQDAATIIIKRYLYKKPQEFINILITENWLGFPEAIANQLKAPAAETMLKATAKLHQDVTPVITDKTDLLKMIMAKKRSATLKKLLFPAILLYILIENNYLNSDQACSLPWTKDWHELKAVLIGLYISPPTPTGNHVQLWAQCDCIQICKNFMAENATLIKSALQKPTETSDLTC